MLAELCTEYTIQCRFRRLDSQCSSGCATYSPSLCCSRSRHNASIAKYWLRGRHQSHKPREQSGFLPMEHIQVAPCIINNTIHPPSQGPLQHAPIINGCVFELRSLGVGAAVRSCWCYSLPPSKGPPLINHYWGRGRFVQNLEGWPQYWSKSQGVGEYKIQYITIKTYNNTYMYIQKNAICGCGCGSQLCSD